MNIAQTLRDPELLGAALGPIPSWTTWLLTLQAVFGLPLNRQDRRIFESIAKRSPPKARVRSFYAILGRRSGKSRMSAAVAVFIAMFQEHKIAPGELATVLVMSPTTDQAKIVFRYILAFIQSSPVLQGEIVNVTADTILLRNNVQIEVTPASFRTTRV